jgi:hypothetical protein
MGTIIFPSVNISTSYEDRSCVYVLCVTGTNFWGIDLMTHVYTGTPKVFSVKVKAVTSLDQVTKEAIIATQYPVTTDLTLTNDWPQRYLPGYTIKYTNCYKYNTID